MADCETKYPVPKIMFAYHHRQIMLKARHVASYHRNYHPIVRNHASAYHLWAQAQAKLIALSVALPWRQRAGANQYFRHQAVQKVLKHDSIEKHQT